MLGFQIVPARKDVYIMKGPELGTPAVSTYVSFLESLCVKNVVMLYSTFSPFLKYVFYTMYSHRTYTPTCNLFSLQAEVFAEFWGDKAELRKYPDGIYSTVTWRKSHVLMNMIDFLLRVSFVDHPFWIA